MILVVSADTRHKKILLVINFSYFKKISLRMLAKSRLKKCILLFQFMSVDINKCSFTNYFSLNISFTCSQESQQLM